MSGAGPAYALPVVYEPQILPDGQSLDDVAEYSGNLEDLVEQWVTLVEDNGEDTDNMGEWTMQAPDVAVSGWDNLARMSLSPLFIDSTKES